MNSSTITPISGDLKYSVRIVPLSGQGGPQHVFPFGRWMKMDGDLIARPVTNR